jgi:acetyltransferase-like isoleucine patch superfamily enzyme
MKPTWNNYFSLGYVKKGIHFFLLHISKQFFIPPSLRPMILKLCGVKFKKAKTVFIGTDVLFDNVKNTKTEIGNNVVITSGVKMINHYPILSKNGVSEYKTGNIIIEDNVFIGMNSLIIKPLTIGKGAVIGAGSVVTKNIPQEAIVAGNPAEIISYVKD